MSVTVLKLKNYMYLCKIIVYKTLLISTIVDLS